MICNQIHHLFITLLFSVLSTVVLGQEQIKWYTWEEAMVKAENEDKKFVIDLYTDWCGWCKKMDKATFQKAEIAAFVNEHYIAIKFDAEQKEDITFKDEIYRFVKGGRRGYHTLAAALTNGRLSYPTIVFLDEDKNLIQAIPGFQGPDTFNPILHYFAYDMHQKMAWATFLREFNSGGDMQSETKDNNGHGVLVGQKRN